MGNAIGAHSTRLHFLEAAKHGDVEFVLNALHTSSFDILYTAQTWTGRTICHVAAQHGQTQLLSSLVQACFDSAPTRRRRVLARLGHGPVAIVRSLINDRDSRGITPLMVAAMHGQVDTLKYLLCLGADPWLQVRDRCSGG